MSVDTLDPTAFESYASFGPMVASVDVDLAVLACLRRWMPDYLQAVRDNKGLEYDLAEPRVYANVIQDDEWKDASLPAVLVATAKTQGRPMKDEDQEYTAAWLVAISCVIASKTPALTRANASYYELAARLIVTQQLERETDGPVAKAAWLSGGEARPLTDPLGKNRWLGEGASQFVVWTDEVMDASAGPDEPGQYPYLDPPPLVASVTLNGEEVDSQDDP